MGFNNQIAKYGRDYLKLLNKNKLNMCHSQQPPFAYPKQTNKTWDYILTKKTKT